MITSYCFPLVTIVVNLKAPNNNPGKDLQLFDYFLEKKPYNELKLVLQSFTNNLNSKNIRTKLEL